MKTLLLLPNSFKRPGTIMSVAGLLLWCLTQQDLFDKLLTDRTASLYWPKIMVLSISFFSFLFGFAFLVFAKEKVEDEYINNTRLRSFQLAAASQVLFFVISFVYLFLFKKEPSVGYLLLCIIVFWLFYMVNFHVTLYKNKRRFHEE